MPISTSSSGHFPLSGGSRARRRRILWTMNQEELLYSDDDLLCDEEESFVPESESVMQDADCIDFNSLMTFSGIDLNGTKKPITFPGIDELLTDENSLLESTDEAIPEFQLESESGIISDSIILSSSSDITNQNNKAASFQEIRDLLNSDSRSTWLFAGDSVTHGANFTQGYRIYSEHFSERIRTEMNRSNDVIINTAVTGETSKTLLKKLEDRIIRFQPDVVSLMVGMDDSESGVAGRSVFRKNLQSIIEQVRESGIHLILHTPPYFDPSEHKAHADIRAYVKVTRDLAREYWIPCLDHWNLWKVAMENQQKIAPWYASNGAHPSARGHHELAKQIFRRLGIYDEKSLTCSESVS